MHSDTKLLSGKEQSIADNIPNGYFQILSLAIQEPDVH